MNTKIKSFATQVKDLNEAQGIVTIAIAHFNNEDRAGDIIRKGAFRKTMKEQIDHIKHQLDHSMSVNDMVGVPVKMYETEDYAVVESALALNTTQGRNVFELYKLAQQVGRSLEHSFRYITMKRNNNNDIPGEDIAELALRYEYSTVLAGCNPHTPLLDIKSVAGRAKMIQSLDYVLKAGAFEDTIYKALEQYRDSLMHSDDEPSKSLVGAEPLSVDDVAESIKKILFN